MNIALIGYGRMGKAIERIAKDKGHSITYINNGEPLDVDVLKAADVAIEFTRPESALENITAILKAGIPVVSGTTGWLENKSKADAAALEGESAFLYASNFSLGVNLFFIVNERLASMMSPYKEYKPKVHEIHHTGKKDAPSGTAITTAEGILSHYDGLNGWSLDGTENTLPITDERIDPYCGTHTVTYESTIDRITLEHHAYSREGFAQGAVLAAEWLKGQKGIFGMRDVLGL